MLGYYNLINYFSVIRFENALKVVIILASSKIKIKTQYICQYFSQFEYKLGIPVENKLGAPNI